MKKDKSKQNRKNFKVILLGEAGVGKTSLITRYARGKFSPQTTTTVGVDRIPLKIQLGDDENEDENENDDTLDFQVLDTAGCFAFRSLIQSYINNIDAVVFVYDITDKESFACLPLWNDIINRTTGKRLVKILVGNKKDLEKDREVQFKNAKNYAEFEGMGVTEVSVKEETGDDVFQRLAKELREKHAITNTEKRNTTKEKRETYTEKREQTLPRRPKSADITKESKENNIRRKFRSLFMGREKIEKLSSQCEGSHTLNAPVTNPYMLNDYIASLINYA